MKLYAATGDANQRFDLPQNPAKLNGKVLRVNLDGSIHQTIHMAMRYGPSDSEIHKGLLTETTVGIVLNMAKHPMMNLTSLKKAATMDSLM